MNIITSLFFFLSVLIIGLIPFPLLYIVSNFLRFILLRVAKYRRAVVENNLLICFPELDKKNHKRLVKLSYQNLADNILEGIKDFSMTSKQILKRHKILNPELLQPYLKNGKSIIGVTGHYANWEWGSLSASLQIKTNVVAFYKKLNNPLIDKFVRRSRAKFGTILASIRRTAETFEANANITTIYLMAADQRTLQKNLEKSYWVNFFGKKTAFLHGPEKYSRQYNLPVFYIDIQRIKRGFYEVELSLLTDEPRELPEGELTKMYAQKLEEIIMKKPQDWLWSHRRWK
jgi:KDO2-lipid IV(A) lauroyltransferase